jgi:hypothetical protein
VTYNLISTVTVGAGGAASIDFTSISGSFTDLVVVLSGRSVATPGNPYDYAKVTINGNTASITERSLGGNGSTAFSFSSPGNYVGEVPSANATSNTFNNMTITFPNYAGSTNKSFSADSVSENNATGAQSAITAGLWSNIAAITSLSFAANGGNWAQYSTATLYGIN